MEGNGGDIDDPVIRSRGCRHFAYRRVIGTSHTRQLQQTEWKPALRRLAIDNCVVRMLNNKCEIYDGILAEHQLHPCKVRKLASLPELLEDVLSDRM